MSHLLILERHGYKVRLSGEKVAFTHDHERALDPVTARSALNNAKTQKSAIMAELAVREALLREPLPNFVNLHVHSDFSVFDGFSTVEEIVATAAGMGQKVVAVTDHGTTSGLHRAAVAAKKLGVKLIPGVEGYFNSDVGNKESPNAHILILAKNREGWHNMNRIVTQSHRQRYRKPLISLQDLKRNRNGLIVTTACRGGLLSIPGYREHIREFRQILGEDFFIELQTGWSDAQIEFNRRAAMIAAAEHIPMVVTSDAHYATVRDAATHAAWIRLSGDKGYYNDDYSLASLDTAVARLSYLPVETAAEAIRNTARIAERCDVPLLESRKSYPVSAAADPMQSLRELCMNGWKRRELDQKSEAEQAVYRERLESELDVLDKASYVDYLLTVSEVGDFCRRSGILMGPGRGSAVGSLVVYLLGLTAVDPVSEGLIFERFCHLLRISPPDIDVDVQASRRGEVLQFIKARYPFSQAVRSVILLKDKAAIHRAGQALKITPAIANQVAANVESLQTAPPRSPVAGLPDAEYRGVLDLAGRFVGRVQSFGKHASALVLFPDEPGAWCAIERQGDDYLTAFDHEELEQQGLLKIDILGLIAMDTVQSVAAEAGTEVSFTNLPSADAATMKLLKSGAMTGIFQLESDGMRRLFRQANPQCLRDLVPLIALYRPGPLNSGMVDEYLRLGSGEVKPIYLHQDLEPILRETRGQIVYQEQIMQIVTALGGFDPGEADMFRRAVAKKKGDEMKDMITKFHERAAARGYSWEMLDTLTQQIISFAEYAFNKSHSAAYAVLTYTMAYLKANHPGAFFSVALNHSIGDQEKTARLVAEARVIELRIKLPAMDAPTSQWRQGGDNTLIVGLQAVKGFGSTNLAANPGLSADAYYGSLTKGPGKLRSNVLRSLVAVGYFGEETPKLMERLGVNKAVEEAQLEFMGFTVRDPLLTNTEVVVPPHYVAAEVIAAMHKITRRGEKMVFAGLRTNTGIMEVRGFRSVAEEISVGKVFAVMIRDGVVVNARPLV